MSKVVNFQNNNIHNKEICSDLVFCVNLGLLTLCFVVETKLNESAKRPNIANESAKRPNIAGFKNFFNQQPLKIEETKFFITYRMNQKITLLIMPCCWQK